MKGIPVVKSKLIMPQKSHFFVLTDRIRRLCLKMHNQNVVMITAPAGYGKTTLMVAALRLYAQESGVGSRDSGKNTNSQDCRICWYRLEQEDRDLVVFYAHFLRALFPKEEKVWNDLWESIANYGDIHTQYQYLNAIICRELWAFHKNIRTYIILDDFQQVKESREITESMQYLVNNLPANCSLFIGTRCETGILTVKQRLEKNILEIGPAELRFSEAELSTLLKESYKVKTNKALIQKIISHTEGWAAGIIILCQALNKDNAYDLDSILDKPEGKDLLFKYFAYEVLRINNPELILFLVKATILREFTAAEAGKILDIENVQQLLTQCEKRGLFIQKIIGEVTTYRFHGLFREVLLQVQPDYLSGKEIEYFHLKTAQFYIENKNFTKAIEHFIACNNVKLAVELITRESVNLIALEAFEQLRLWFKLLPDEVVNNNAILLLIKSYTYQRGEKEIVILSNRALSFFKENNDSNMQIRTLFLLNAFYQFKNDMRNAINTMCQAQTAAKSACDLPDESIITVINLIKAVGEEKYSSGIAACQDADRLKLDEDWQWITLMYSCLLHCLLGELNAAGSFIKKALGMNLIKRTELLKGFALVYYALVSQLRNDHDAFGAAKSQTISIGEKFNIAFMLGFGQRLSAIEKYCKHDLPTALELLDSSTSHFDRLGNHALRSLNILNRCLWLSRQQNPKELLAEAKKVFRCLASSRPGQCIIEISQSILGALAREAGEYEFAEYSLLASIKKSQTKNAKQILCGSYLHLAKLYYDIGEKVKGEDILRHAFSIAASNGYVMFWDLHLPTMVEMSARCIKNNIYSEHAMELITSYYGKEAMMFLKNKALTIEESSLKDSCHTFISLYGNESMAVSNSMNIYLFGNFSIAVNGAEINETNWKTKKIAGILKYLILHRGKMTSRESLMELFWPESDKKAASMSLRAALYELRKVLTLFGIPLEGKDSLIYEKSSGLVVPASGMFSVDVNTFLSLNSELKRLPSPKSEIQRTDILEKMVSIYRGNLLEDEPYEDWAFFEREKLKSIYLEAALELTAIYIERKDSGKTEEILLKTLALDPYNEQACLFLLKLYISTNQRGRALKLYADFEKYLKKELNVKPDEKLVSIIRNIAQ